MGPVASKAGVGLDNLPHCAEMDACCPLPNGKWAKLPFRGTFHHLIVRSCRGPWARPIAKSLINLRPICLAYLMQ